MKLLRRGRYCAPIAERKGKSAGVKNHLEENDTRRGGVPQAGLSSCVKDSGRSEKKCEYLGNKNLNPCVDVPRPIREAWRRYETENRTCSCARFDNKPCAGPAESASESESDDQPFACHARSSRPLPASAYPRIPAPPLNPDTTPKTGDDRSGWREWGPPKKIIRTRAV
jgi:hypothetical protein